MQTHAFRGKSQEDFDVWSNKARPALRKLIGLDRLDDELAGFQPSVTLEAPEDLCVYTRQKGALHAEPGFDVPFWFLKPKGRGPFPPALFPHGHYPQHGSDYAVGISHSEEMHKKIEEQDRDVAVQAVQRGFVAIAPATRGFPPAGIPDITSRHGNQNCRSHMLHSLLAGRTLTGERVWDLLRLIDWAETRRDIDTSTVLMVGNSGGGTLTLYAAACDERITTSVVSCAYCTLVGKNGAVHHCDCNAVPGILRFGEFYDVAGLIAPRRLLLVHGRDDPLFATVEIDRAVLALRRIYDIAEASDAMQHRVGPGGHRFYADIMWPFVEKATNV